MRIPLFQIDAFTGTLFRGNPAAVCPLEDWLEDTLLQSIAAENNLSETAFFVESGEDYQLRWFTPTTEVRLCGHATLASAHVIWNHLRSEKPRLNFHTRGGVLSVERRRDLIVLSFPLLEAGRCEDPPETLREGLVRIPLEVRVQVNADGSGNYLAVYEEESAVRNLDPKFDPLAGLTGMGVIATARSEEADFVSRYFAPGFGIPEDPVTGSAHCTLIPYWAQRLGKEQLHAFQVSARGGELFCRLHPGHVEIAGRAVCYLEGTVLLPDPRV